MGDFSMSERQDLRSHHCGRQSELTIRPSPPDRQLSLHALPVSQQSDPVGPDQSSFDAFLLQYVPHPNMMMMAQAPDSNNYLDIRNENHYQDQGTVRWTTTSPITTPSLDATFIGTEHGFSPSSGVTATTENLPGFGANFDNLFAAGGDLLEPRLLQQQGQHRLARGFTPLDGPHIAKRWRQ